MCVPGEPDFFVIKAHELLYNEVSASNLVKVDMRLEDVDEAAGLHPTWRAVVGAPGRELFLSHPHSRLHCRRQPDCGLLPVSQSDEISGKLCS
jgi:ribulose-5-phosphate 4-epimerase/fuculose-1-phosphate aldolase